MIEGLLKSDFVARLAEKEWVKKNITEQCITLQLQLHSLKGTLTLNVPPSPSDRLEHWQRLQCSLFDNQITIKIVNSLILFSISDCL